MYLTILRVINFANLSERALIAQDALHWRHRAAHFTPLSLQQNHGSKFTLWDKPHDPFASSQRATQCLQATAKPRRNKSFVKKIVSL